MVLGLQGDQVWSDFSLYRHYIYTKDLVTTSHVKIKLKEAKKTCQQAGHRLTDAQ